MKKLTTLLFCCACLMTMAQNKTTKKLNVAIVAYPGMELLDYSGPADVFEKASEITRGQYSVYTAALNIQPVRTANNGVAIIPDFSFDNMPKPDLLVIPGAGMPCIDSLIKDEGLLTLIKKYNAVGDVKIMSVCTGAYLVAAAGLLDNKKATTHFFVSDDFAERFPKISLVKNVRYVDNGSVITSSGVTSGIDAALHIVKENSGAYIGDMVARGIQYVPHEQETWPQPAKGMHYSGSAVAKNVCAVCGMATNGKMKTEYKGKTYLFCSESCKKIFMNNPERYSRSK